MSNYKLSEDLHPWMLIKIEEEIKDEIITTGIGEKGELYVKTKSCKKYNVIWWEHEADELTNKVNHNLSIIPEDIILNKMVGKKHEKKEALSIIKKQKDIGGSQKNYMIKKMMGDSQNAILDITIELLEQRHGLLINKEQIKGDIRHTNLWEENKRKWRNYFFYEVKS